MKTTTVPAKACQQLATKSRKKYAEVVIEKCSLK